MHVSLSELRELVMDREASRAAIHGSQSRTRLSDLNEKRNIIKMSFDIQIFYSNNYILYSILKNLYIFAILDIGIFKIN